MDDTAKKLTDIAIVRGAAHARVIDADKVPFDPSLRQLCEMNSCGMYGKNWMCPPALGEVDDLIARTRDYKYALVYQTIGELEDSFDYEGMEKAGEIQNAVTYGIEDDMVSLPISSFLHLAAGDCKLCPTCSKIEDEPCRHPDKARPSLSAYGVFVSKLAELCGMKYTNGTNTVTYFGVLFYNC